MWGGQRRVLTAEEDVEDALVCGGAPLVHQQVTVSGKAPPRSAEEAHHKVDDEADHCTRTHTTALLLSRTVMKAGVSIVPPQKASVDGLPTMEVQAHWAANRSHLEQTNSAQ